MTNYLQVRSADLDPDPSMWVDEAIWGHRYTTSNPWLTFLEFLMCLPTTDQTGFHRTTRSTSCVTRRPDDFLFANPVQQPPVD
jgi:hypothetical protein